MPSSQSAPRSPEARKSLTPQPTIPTIANVSSTSTLSTSNPQLSTERLRVPYQPIGVITPSVPSRPVIIRADPTLSSCFDPADKELYALWGPKN